MVVLVLIALVVLKLTAMLRALLKKASLNAFPDSDAVQKSTHVCLFQLVKIACPYGFMKNSRSISRCLLSYVILAVSNEKTWCNKKRTKRDLTQLCLLLLQVRV